MRNLDLNSYGVQELSAQEAMKIEGGSWFSRNWKTILKVAGMIFLGAKVTDIYL